MNTSPNLKLYPLLFNLKLTTSKDVDPIPTVVLAAPTTTSTVTPVPVSVVDPIPLLETPTIGRFSYDGAGIVITGSVYPVPALSIVNDKEPPAPTTTETSAPEPDPVLSVTATDTGCR